jgi:hypothetical protein
MAMTAMSAEHHIFSLQIRTDTDSYRFFPNV